MPRRLPGTEPASAADLYWVSALLGLADWSSVASKREMSGLRERVLVLADELDAAQSREHAEAVAAWVQGKQVAS